MSSRSTGFVSRVDPRSCRHACRRWLPCAGELPPAVLGRQWPGHPADPAAACRLPRGAHDVHQRVRGPPHPEGLGTANGAEPQGRTCRRRLVLLPAAARRLHSWRFGLRPAQSEANGPGRAPGDAREGALAWSTWHDRCRRLHCQEAASGTTWGAQDLNLENFLLGGYFSQEAAELAQDALAKEMIPTLLN